MCVHPELNAAAWERVGVCRGKATWASLGTLELGPMGNQELTPTSSLVTQQPWPLQPPGFGWIQVNVGSPWHTPHPKHHQHWP